MDAMNLIRKFLPPQAKMLEPEEPNQKALVCMADLDGDGAPEIMGAYRWQGEIYILVLKKYAGHWFAAATIKGKGYGVSYFHAAPVTSRRRSSLIVGWKKGAIWSNLAIYEWTREGLKDIAPQDLYYSLMEIDDMPGTNGKDGKAEIALWSHDTGEAYKVRVYRWGHGKLVPAYDVYPFYFKKVVNYYQQKTKEMPEAAFYWYYLAVAQMKAGMPVKALKSMEAGLSLHSTYPSQEEWIKLGRKIGSVLELRAIRLYSASIKTAEGVKWGYIDSKGIFFIPPQYDYAEEFQENGLAVVQVQDVSGLINQSGEFVVAPKYSSIDEFSEGRAAVIDKQGFKVIDERGRILTSEPYSYIGTYQEGRALFTDASYQYGYLDQQGKEAIPPQYVSGTNFKEGKAVVQIKEGEFALIGPNGERIQTYPYAFVGPLSDGLLAFKPNIDGKFGYIDEKGTVIIRPTFTSAQSFESGRAVVNMLDNVSTSQYGLINKQGDFLIRPAYNDIQLLGEGRVAVGKAKDLQKPYMGSKYAIADMDGHFLTDFIYNDVTHFRHGLASANNEDYTFFINQSGSIVRSLPIIRGGGTLSVEGDLIRAVVDQRIFYYDRTGKLVWRQNTIIPLSNSYRVREEKYKPNKDYYVYYPQIEGMENKAVQERINQRLKELSQVKKIESNVQLESSYAGDFSVAFFKKQLLVLQLTGYDYPFGAAHGMPSQMYVHVDLATGKMYELKDLFKPNSDYVKVLSDMIGKQIQTNPEYSYVFPNSYKEIKADQPFYVKEFELYIYFDIYDIAPYVAGFPTFKIPFSEIMDILNVTGEFWRAFHE